MEKKRSFCMDGDCVEVSLVYDPELKREIYDYPDFEEHPRTTPLGRPWVNVTKDNCPYSDEDYDDCGSCGYFRSQRPGDLIGVCDHDLRKED